MELSHVRPVTASSLTRVHTTLRKCPICDHYTLLVAQSTLDHRDLSLQGTKMVGCETRHPGFKVFLCI